MKVWNIKPPMKRRDIRSSLPAKGRKMRVTRVEVNNVKCLSLLQNLFELKNVVCERLFDLRIEAKGSIRTSD